jgi:hypothetical protein
MLHWTLVFTMASLEHVAARHIDAADVADAVVGRYGPVWVRRGGRGSRERWFVMAQVSGGELMTCVLRAAERRDVDADGAIIMPLTGLPKAPGAFSESMRFCVTAWISDDDEARSYRAWRRSKGGQR